jgi:hypothetical protein
MVEFLPSKCKVLNSNPSNSGRGWRRKNIHLYFRSKIVLPVLGTRQANLLMDNFSTRSMERED